MKFRSIAFTFSGRELAFAVFHSQRLEFWEAHAFLSGADRALQSAVAQVAKCVMRFEPNAAVVESLRATGRPGKIALQVKETLRSLAVPIFEVSEQELFSAFGIPALRNREELRNTVLSIFPQQQNSRFMHPCLDAAALGLHFETNRLLSF